jgi:hypothetical protein
MSVLEDLASLGEEPTMIITSYIGNSDVSDFHQHHPKGVASSWHRQT